MNVMPRHWVRAALALACGVLCTGASHGQTHWREQDVPPPAGLSRERLIPFSVGAGSELAYHLDATSLAIGSDGVVRYVVLASSRSGAENALFEGLRCETGEATTYARWNSSEQRWVAVTPNSWRILSGIATSRVALRLAQTALCDGRAPNAPVARMLADLQRGGKLIGDERVR